MLLDDLHTQRVMLSILVLQDGTVDTDQVCTVKTYRGLPDDCVFNDEFIAIDELTTQQFDHFTNLEEVKREIAVWDGIGTGCLGEEYECTGKTNYKY